MLIKNYYSCGTQKPQPQWLGFFIIILFTLPAAT
jgi:hypothetical protein